MNRFVAKTAQILLDVAVLSFALWAAFYLRFEGDVPFQMIKRMFFAWPYVVALQYAGLAVFKVPRFAWRFVGLREIVRILAGLSLAALFLLLVRYGAAPLRPSFVHLVYAMVPTSILLMDLALAFLGVSGVRILRRLWGERRDQGRHCPRTRRVEPLPTLLVGAGCAGVAVAKEIASRRDLAIQPVGFLDDDPLKIGSSFHGIEVLGPLSELEKWCARHQVRQVLITIAAARGAFVRDISGRCERLGLPVKIVPGLSEIVGQSVSVSRIRNVTIEDLLRRDPIVLDSEAIHAELRNRVVLVTGAGGSIGSELCRQICRFSPRRLVLVEQAENALFQIHRELKATFPECDVVPCIADVCDGRRVEALFEAHAPHHVFHAAAHKHVPMMEWNPCESVKNNVFGTRTVADAAHRHGVQRFVMISTDKAVNPTSVMGATKRVAELYVQSLSQRSQTRFVAVRFGNVLGSAGSVIPVFKEQIAAGGPVTVTHPEMRRYFMTIPEASQLVLQAGAMGEGGEIYVLDMGDPVYVLDLAKDLIRLSGLVPGDDIDIQFTGLRPGEKLFEELSLAGENATHTRHPKIFIGKLSPQPAAAVEATLSALARLVESDPSPEEVRAALRAAVPEYTPVVPGGEADSSPLTPSIEAVRQSA